MAYNKVSKTSHGLTSTLKVLPANVCSRQVGPLPLELSNPPSDNFGYSQKHVKGRLHHITIVSCGQHGEIIDGISVVHKAVLKGFACGDYEYIMS